MSALLVCLGCAESEPLDIAKHHGTDVTGAAGLPDVSGTAGTSGTAGAAGATGLAGNTGVSGTAGTTGSAGAKSSITSGQAGDSSITTTGTGGSGGDSSGQAGTTGIAGAGGSGGTGFAGRGGTTGSAGRGGTTGSAGRGGTTGTGGSSVDAGANPDGAATQTFTDVYNTILVTYCAGSSCHNPGSQGGISFASKAVAYDAILPRLIPGNGANSSFYRTVNSGSMPRGQAKLSAANLAKIKAWIDQGALEN